MEETFLEINSILREINRLRMSMDYPFLIMSYRGLLGEADYFVPYVIMDLRGIDDPAKLKDEESLPKEFQIPSWSEVKQKIKPDLAANLKEYLGRVQETRNAAKEELKRIEKLLDLTHELRNLLIHQCSVSRVELVPQELDFEEEFHSIKENVTYMQQDFEAILNLFPGNPFLIPQREYTMEERKQMEEARPFPNPWKKARQDEDNDDDEFGPIMIMFEPN